MRRRDQEAVARGPRRALSVVAGTVGATVTFVLAAACGALLHMGTAPARRVIVKTLNSVLAPMFQGTLSVEELGGLGLRGVSGLRVNVRDASGAPLLVLDGVQADVDVVATVRSLVLRTRDLAIDVTSVRIATADVVLDRGAAGSLSLADAFNPRSPSTTPTDPDAGGVAISLKDVRIQHLWAHGHALPSMAPLDVDLDGLTGQLTIDPGAVVVDVGRVAIRARNLPEHVDPSGEIEGHLRVPSLTSGQPIDVSGSFTGLVAQQPTTLRGSMNGRAVEGFVDIPRIEPATLAQVTADIPLHDRAALHLEARGTLPTLAATMHAAVGPGTIDANVDARIEEAIAASVALSANGIDLQTFAPDRVRSDLSLRASAELRSTSTSDGTHVDGTYDLDSAVGQLSGQVVPHAHIAGSFTEATVTGKGTVDEAGASTTVDFSLHPIAAAASPDVVDFDVSVAANELAGVPRLGRAAAGRARLRAHGRYELASARVRVRAEADVEGVSAARGDVRVGSGKLEATAYGHLPNAAVDLHVSGANLFLAGYSFASFQAGITGSALNAQIRAALTGEDAPDVRLDAHVMPGSVTTADHVGLSLHKGDVDVAARIGRVRIGEGIAALEGMRIDGAGEDPTYADVALEGRGVRVRARSADVDLARLGRLLAMEDTIKKGRLSFDVNVNATRSNAHGTINASLSGGQLADARDASGHLAASFDGRRLEAKLDGAVGDVGRVAVVADDVVLGGAPVDTRSWRRAVGHVHLKTDVELTKLAALLPNDLLPVDDVTGRLQLEASLTRGRATDRPDVDAEIATQGLGFVLRRRKQRDPSGTDVKPVPVLQGVDVLTAGPFQSRGTDVELALHLKGKADTTLEARLVDAHGVFAQISASGSPPYERLLGQGAGAPWQSLPLKLRVIVPPRDLASFPSFARAATEGLHGSVQGVLEAEGTVAAPRLTLKGRAFDFTGSDGEHPTRVNVEVLASYENREGKLVTKVARPEGLVAEVEGTAKLARDNLLPSGGTPLAWEASGSAHFTGFPIDAVPLIAQNRTHGSLTGDVALAGLRRDAKASVNLSVAGLRVGQTHYSTATLVAEAANGALTGALRLAQPDGFADARVQAGLVWGASTTPTLDPARPLTATFKAKAFRAGVAQPFLGDAVSELDGRVDADATLTYELSKKNGTVVGSVDVRDGLFEVPAAGGEFHGVRAHMTMNPLGTVHVTDLSASGATGRLAGTATVQLDGLAVRTAVADLHVNRREKLPVEVNGVPFGNIYGDINVSARLSPDGKQASATVKLPKLYVELPPSTGHSVQELDRNPDITIGVREPNLRFASVPIAKPEQARPASSTQIHLAVALGNEVWVKRGTMFKVQLHGGPHIDITDKTRITGQIGAGPGTVEVQGKEFELDNAVASFVNKDPANPQLVASAHWDAPSKTRVFVDVSGSPEDLHLAFRSEPGQLSQDAILSLILFGDENGSLGSSSAASQGDNEDVNEAASVAGGVVTQGLNKAIAGVTAADITTRVDTSQSQNPRPELAVQITKDVSATIAYNLGLPPPGQNPDHTQLTLDYRFFRNWSLLTTLGDAGSSIVDLQWQYRY